MTAYSRFLLRDGDHVLSEQECETSGQYFAHRVLTLPMP